MTLLSAALAMCFFVALLLDYSHQSVPHPSSAGQMDVSPQLLFDHLKYPFGPLPGIGSSFLQPISRNNPCFDHLEELIETVLVKIVLLLPALQNRAHDSTMQLPETS